MMSKKILAIEGFGGVHCIQKQMKAMGLENQCLFLPYDFNYSNNPIFYKWYNYMDKKFAIFSHSFGGWRAFKEAQMYFLAVNNETDPRLSPLKAILSLDPRHGENKLLSTLDFLIPFQKPFTPAVMPRLPIYNFYRRGLLPGYEVHTPCSVNTQLPITVSHTSILKNKDVVKRIELIMKELS